MRVGGLLADGRHHDDGQPPAQTRAQTVDDRLPERRELHRVDLLLHEERAAHDGAVDGDQRQEDTQLAVERRRELLDDHLHELHEGGDRGDEDDEGEEAQIDALDQSAGLEHVFVQEVVQGHGHHHHERDGGSEAQGRLHALRHGDVGAHAEEEGEDHVVDENRPDEDIQ